MAGNKSASPTPIFLFDLDGTLIDSVYQHVLAWREALETLGVVLSNWKIHRRIGMSGGLIIHAFTRDTGRKISAKEAEHLQKLHGEAYARREKEVQLLPGAKELLAGLDRAKVKWAIATSGKRDKAQFALDMLEIGDDVPVITRDEVERAKPAPDLFVAAAKKVGVELGDCVVVGDSVWDLLAARRARALGVGVLSGGYGETELYQAGAYRVYADPGDLLAHLDEVGVRME
jgi:HAD superfamily hydrolase (TIGR01549 family)